jgi:lipopolysaccharide transport system ATP-binding protein
MKFQEKIILEMEYEVTGSDNIYFIPNFHIYSVENVLLFIATPPNGAIKEYAKGVYRATCVIPGCTLNDGVFRVTLALSSIEESVVIHFLVPHALTFNIVDDFSDVSYRNGFMHAIPGLFRPKLSWGMEKLF